MEIDEGNCFSENEGEGARIYTRGEKGGQGSDGVVATEG